MKIRVPYHLLKQHRMKKLEVVLQQDERGVVDVDPEEGEAVEVVDVEPVEGEAVEVVRQIVEGGVEGERGMALERQKILQGKVCYINSVMCFISSCILLRSPFDREPTDVSESSSGLPSRQLSIITKPTGPIKSNREFRLALIEELMQPLLLAKASGQSALYQGARRPRKDFSRLKGKHFTY